MDGEDFGGIGDEVRLDAVREGPMAVQVPVRFEGEALDRLRYAIRELGIQPTLEFFRDAALAAIDAREAEVGSGAEGRARAATSGGS